MKPGPIHIILWRKYGLTLQESNISAPVSKGKGVMICYGSSTGFVDNALLWCRKDISKCYIDYHQNMNCEVFESWFGDKLIPNLSKDGITLIVLDNAQYHCRLMEKHLQWKWENWYDWIHGKA